MRLLKVRFRLLKLRLWWAHLYFRYRCEIVQVQHLPAALQRCLGSASPPEVQARVSGRGGPSFFVFLFAITEHVAFRTTQFVSFTAYSLVGLHRVTVRRVTVRRVTVRRASFLRVASTLIEIPRHQPYWALF
jgi:hypothetical protein